MLLKDKLEPYRLLLASQSPRRRELMAGCGLPYEPAPKYECEEIYPDSLPAEEVPLFLSRLKSEAYPAPLGPNDILLTADTVVISDGEVLGKPCDRGQAAQMLRRLSGRRHTVVSGVTLRTAGRMHTFSAESGVWFRPLSEEEIGYYLDTFAPYDKAGSYGIQEWIGYAAIEKINGSFYNVMGLPIQKILRRIGKNFCNNETHTAYPHLFAFRTRGLGRRGHVAPKPDFAAHRRHARQRFPAHGRRHLFDQQGFDERRRGAVRRRLHGRADLGRRTAAVPTTTAVTTPYSRIRASSTTT